METNRENCIEWLTGDDTIGVTLTQKRYITKVERLAEKQPNLVQIIARNSDGSIFAHLPLKALKLNIISAELSEEQKKERADRLRKNKSSLCMRK